MNQPSRTRIARAAQALRELTLDDLLLAVSLEAATHALAAASVLSAIPAHDWTSEVHPDVRALMIEGRKINAIKRQRELTDMSLKDAKDFVERFWP